MCGLMKESGLLKAFLCKQNSGPLVDPGAGGKVMQFKKDHLMLLLPSPWVRYETTGKKIKYRASPSANFHRTDTRI